MSSMHFYPGPSEDQAMILDLVSGFSKDVVAPLAEQMDHDGRVPADILAQLGEMGLYSIPIAEEDGGSGFDFTSHVLALVELARGSGSLAMHVTNQCDLFLAALASSGKGDHAAFAAVASGEAWGALALHEEEERWNQYSFTMSLVDGHLSGSRTWVAGAPGASWFLVPCGSGDELALCLVEASRSGVQVENIQGRLGFTAIPSATVHFDKVEIHDDDVLVRGTQAQELLGDMRCRGLVAHGAIACGLTAAAQDAAGQYAAERVQFRRPIAAFEAIRQRLASSELALGAGMSLVVAAGRALDDGKNPGVLPIIAKVEASRGARRAADDALQIYGGYGFSQEYPAERIYRDACSLTGSYGGNDALCQELALSVLPSQ